MPVGWIIFASVLLFFCLLFLIPIRFCLLYEKDFRITLRVLFLRFSLYPKGKKVRLWNYSPAALRRRREKARKKALKKRQQEAQKEAKSKKTAQAEKPRRSFSDIVYTLRVILFILKRTKKSLLSLFTLHIDRLEATVATGDAAKTAILYGQVAGLFGLIREAAGRYIRWKENTKHMHLEPDFLAEKSKVSVHITLSTNLFRVLRLGICAAFSFLLSKSKVKKKKGKTVQSENAAARIADINSLPQNTLTGKTLAELPLSGGDAGNA